METRIRLITEYSELQKCVAFQHLIWGGDFAELVAAPVLWVAVRTGGLVAGAFDEHDNMVGFLFGVTGFMNRRPIHWSDMLGVHPKARGAGIGQALKRFQRDTLLQRGVSQVQWTFDPLESGNAHLNFARLGITSREYIIDAYGRTTSFLHAGLDTDRLVASWDLVSDRVRDRMDRNANPPSGAEFGAAPLINAREAPDLSLTEPRIRLRIPSNIQAIKQKDLSEAARWREVTRAAFTAYFARGYEAVELIRANEASFYILSHQRRRRVTASV